MEKMIMYEISIPNPETLKDNPWWKNGGEILYWEIAAGPFSVDKDSCVRPALPQKIKQSFNTCSYQKWQIDDKTNERFIYVPTWICFEIMRIAQLIKHSESCPLKFTKFDDSGFVLIKKPSDSEKNEILEKEYFYECGGYCIIQTEMFEFDSFKQFKSSAIPFNEELLMRTELALLPSDEYDMDDMIYVGEKNPEEELNEGEYLYKDDDDSSEDNEDEEGEEWKKGND